MQETGCQIRLRTSHDNTPGGQHHHQQQSYVLIMHLEIERTRENARHTIIEVERLLVSTLHYEDKGLALYFMALLNEHRLKNTHNKVVHQCCGHLKHMTKAMKYMYASRLPENYKEIIGRPSRKEWQSQETNDGRQ